MEFLLAKLRILTYCPKQGVPGVYLVELFYCTALLITTSFWKLFSLGGFRIGLSWWQWWFSSFFYFFFFITFFFFSLAVSSQLSSGAPILPLPKEGWLCRFYLDPPILLGLQEIPLLVFYLSFISWWLQVSSSNFFPRPQTFICLC